MCAHGASLLLLPENEISLYPFFPHWQDVQGAEPATAPCGEAIGPRRSPGCGAPGISPRFPSGPLLDETMDRVLPDFVISGCNLLDFQARVFAGLVVGWIHKPVALGVERSYGRGRIVASTFQLFQNAPLADPTAATLLDTMITLSLESREHRLEEAVRAAEFAS